MFWCHAPLIILSSADTTGPAYSRRPKIYAYDLESLKEWKTTLGIKVYAYCLMTNHVHLIIEPDEDCAAVGKLMRRLAGRQTRFVNALEDRVGTL